VKKEILWVLTGILLATVMTYGVLLPVAAQPAPPRFSIYATETNVAVSDTVTDLTSNGFRAGIPVSGVEMLVCEVVNADSTGSNATDKFTIQYQVVPGGSWFDWLTDTDFDSTAIDALKFCTTTGPQELTAATSASFKIDVRGFYAVKFLASANTAVVDSLTVKCGGY
jgi:hypothetical protein